MNRACLIASTLLATASANADIFLQRNGIDGEFVWRPSNTICYSGGNYLNISLPLSQSGTSSQRSLAYSGYCYIPFGCSGPYFFGITCMGSDVQVASRSTFRYQPNCSGSFFETPGPGGFQQGEYVSADENWLNGFTYTIGQARNPVYLTGQANGLWGVRVRLADGWHYGWLNFSKQTSSTTGTWQGSFMPGAYALEMTPDTPIRIPCRADINYDGVIDFQDYLDYIQLFAANDPGARYNTDDYVLDFFDYLDFLVDYAAGSC
jgi:hypothetical protein